MHAIVNTYELGPEASRVRAEMWDRYVPALQEIPGFLDVYVLESESQPTQGITVTLWASREAAQAYLDSETMKHVDVEAGAFRPAPNRRIMNVFASLSDGVAAASR